MRSKLSIVVRTRLRGVAGEGKAGYAGVGYIFAGYLLVVVGVVVLTIGRVTIHAGDVFTIAVVVGFEFVALLVVLALFVCQRSVEDVVAAVDSVVISSSNWWMGSSVTKGSDPDPS
jgi:hypothetical protein